MAARRLYEIWEQKRFAGSRAKPLALFHERHPELADRVDFGLHRRIPRRPPPGPACLAPRPERTNSELLLDVRCESQHVLSPFPRR